MEAQFSKGEIRLKLLYITSDKEQVHVDPEAWDEWVEPETRIGDLRELLWRNKDLFKFPDDQTMHLHFERENVLSRLGDKCELNDSRIKKKHIGGTQSVSEATLYVIGWLPEWEFTFLRDYYWALLDPSYRKELQNAVEKNELDETNKLECKEAGAETVGGRLQISHAEKKGSKGEHSLSQHKKKIETEDTNEHVVSVQTTGQRKRAALAAQMRQVRANRKKGESTKIVRAAWESLTNGWSELEANPAGCAGVVIHEAHLCQFVQRGIKPLDPDLIDRPLWDNTDTKVASDRSQDALLQDGVPVRLAGSIPLTVGSCDRLRVLNLSSNMLHGEIPVSICDCRCLQELYLQDNMLCGPLPLALGQLRQLANLVLTNNKLVGPLPASIGKCTQLKCLWLKNNRLQGPIPNTLGNCSKIKLVDLSQNSIDGFLPPTLGKLSKLQMFMASQNLLSGPVPGALQHCKHLIKLDLRCNDQLGGIEAVTKLLSEQIGNKLHMFFGK